jgi:ACS family glucarate transporter-like MFS transporter
MTQEASGIERPTGTRGILIAITLAVLQYIYRVAISQAGLMMHDLSPTEERMSRNFSAITLAYALFEIPGGHLGDWSSPRKVLLRIVLWWRPHLPRDGYHLPVRCRLLGIH